MLSFSQLSSAFTLALALVGTGCLQESKEEPDSAGGRPALESSRSASARIGMQGGSLRCESSQGTRFTLEFPPGSLPDSTSITITPLKDMGGMPLAPGFLGGVKCEPAGLEFGLPVLLRIESAPSPSPGQRLLGFSADDTGGTFRLKPARRDSQAIVLSLSHFSLHGASAAAPEEMEELPELAPLLPEDPLVKAEWELALSQAKPGGATLEELAAILRKYYAEVVSPALERSANAEDASRVEGALAVGFFQNLIAFAAAVGEADHGRLLEALDGELQEARTAAGEILKGLIGELNESCAQSGDFDAFLQANHWQFVAGVLNLDSASFGLDRNAFLRDACARAVLDPIQLPSPLQPGTGKSLDMRAMLVVQGDPEPRGAPFSFVLEASGADLQHESGASDASGRFTTVITPRGEGEVVVNAEACAAIDGLTDLCAKGSTSGARFLTVLGKKPEALASRTFLAHAAFKDLVCQAGGSTSDDFRTELPTDSEIPVSLAAGPGSLAIRQPDAGMFEVSLTAKLPPRTRITCPDSSIVTGTGLVSGRVALLFQPSAPDTLSVVMDTTLGPTGSFDRYASRQLFDSDGDFSTSSLKQKGPTLVPLVPGEVVVVTLSWRHQTQEVGLEATDLPLLRMTLPR